MNWFRFVFLSFFFFGWFREQIIIYYSVCVYGVLCMWHLLLVLVFIGFWFLCNFFLVLGLFVEKSVWNVEGSVNLCCLLLYVKWISVCLTKSTEPMWLSVCQYLLSDRHTDSQRVCQCVSVHYVLLFRWSKNTLTGRCCFRGHFVVLITLKNRVEVIWFVRLWLFAVVWRQYYYLVE